MEQSEPEPALESDVQQMEGQPLQDGDQVDGNNLEFFPTESFEAQKTSPDTLGLNMDSTLSQIVGESEPGEAGSPDGPVSGVTVSDPLLPNSSVFQITEPTGEIKVGGHLPLPLPQPLVPFDRDWTEAIKELREGKLPANRQDRPFLGRELERRRLRAIVDRDYDGADDWESLGRKLADLLKEEEIRERQESVINGLYSRWVDLRLEAQARESKTQSHEEELNRRYQQRVLEVKARQERELAELTLDPAKFNRPSPKLLQLRQREKAMAIARRYKEAKELSRLVDRVYQTEQEEANRRLDEALRRERAIMIERHKRELIGLEGMMNRGLATLTVQKRQTLRPVQTAMDRFRHKKPPQTTRPVPLARHAVMAGSERREYQRFRGAVSSNLHRPDTAATQQRPFSSTRADAQSEGGWRLRRIIPDSRPKSVGRPHAHAIAARPGQQPLTRPFRRR